MAKDKGTYSSRINQIVRQAEKVPGPGKYVAHEPWEEGKTAHVTHAGNKFPNGKRDYKPMNKIPAPATYEAKNIALNRSIATGQHLSNRPRTLMGQVPKGKKRSFLDQAVHHGATVPDPGKYTSSQHSSNRLDTEIVKTLSWARSMVKTQSKGQQVKEIGPDHYQLNWKHLEESQACHAVPKAKAQNFLDKAVREKWMDRQNKKECPGPGTYNVHNFDDARITRGTRLLQTRGLGRSAVSGYF
jgi:hypothetical protein